MINQTFTINSEGLVANPKTLKKAFALAPGTYQLKITKKNTRSLQSNNFYWAVCVPMVRQGFVDLGHDVTLDDTHTYLKARFNCKEMVLPETGEVICVPTSTTDLSKQEFGNYLEEIMRFAAEMLNVVIPPPNSQLALDYETR